MSELVEPRKFLELRDQGYTLIDVRSPSEYEEAHIPGAFNIPLFSDEERAQVGTIFKQVGEDEAIMNGLEHAGKKLPNYIKDLRALDPTKKLLIYCWRGGMRSASLAWLFEFAGFKSYRLQGGYKNYRKLVLSSFEEEANLVIIGGLTGSGKTEILDELENLGSQILPLEGVANHKGSAFGALGQENQPSSSMFENLLYEKYRFLDKKKIIFVEDESNNIGKVYIPKPFYHQMRISTILIVELPIEERIKRIIQEYAVFTREQLIESFEKISKRIGFDQLKYAIEALHKDDYETAIKISLKYYDKAYRKGISRREENTKHYLFFEKDDPKINADKIRTFAHKQLLKD